VNWQTFREHVSGGPPEAAVEDLIRIAREMSGTPGFHTPLPPEGSAEEQRLASVLGELIAGKYVEVGPAPQRMLALLVALYLLARDKKVFLFSGLSLGWDHPGESPLPALRERLDFQPDVEWTHEPNEKGYRAQLIFADYPHFIRHAHRHENLLKGQSCAAVFCEVDLCLYDRRLFFFDEEMFQATGALYTGVEGADPWFGRPDLLDARDVLARFDRVCAMTSYTSPRVCEEILSTYRDVLAGRGDTRKNVSIPAAAYRNRREKLQALASDVEVAGGPALVFFLEQRTGDLLGTLLQDAGCRPRELSSMKETFAFITEAGEGDVGLFPGLPALERGAATTKRPTFDVFIAEHYPFEHHHQKIFAFCAKHLTRRYGPYFYLSLEDAVTAVFSGEREHFRKTFGVIDKAEQWLSIGKSVRKWAAWLILRKLYKLRQKRFGNRVPIVTARTPFPQRDEKVRPMKKRIRRQLDGSCFCGSGKPFAECHGIDS
jgi:hypothetical protein